MSRQDVIDAVAEKAEMSKAQAGRALDAFFATVEEGLKKGKDITFVGFGKFSVKNVMQEKDVIQLLAKL